MRLQLQQQQWSYYCNRRNWLEDEIVWQGGRGYLGPADGSRHGYGCVPVCAGTTFRTFVHILLSCAVSPLKRCTSGERCTDIEISRISSSVNNALDL